MRTKTLRTKTLMRTLFLHLHTPFPYFSPSLISLVVSVEAQLHVYLYQANMVLNVYRNHKAY